MSSIGSALRQCWSVVAGVWNSLRSACRRLGGLTKAFVVIIGGLVLSAVSVVIVVWTVFLVGKLLPDNFGKMFDTAAMQRSLVGAAQTAHSSVTGWVLHCVAADSPRELPRSIRTHFYANPLQAIRDSDDEEIDVKTDAVPNPPELAKKLKRLPTVREISAVQLSEAMVTQRVELGRKTNAAYGFLQFLQWLAILVGLITTVVVSVSSTELFGKSDTRLGISLRFLAILLPAVGTAIAAINAFYGPRDEWNRASTTLANITQLHGQLAVGVWALECDEKDDNKRALTAKLDEWTKRYNDIVTLAETSAATSNDTKKPIEATSQTSGSLDGVAPAAPPADIKKY